MTESSAPAAATSTARSALRCPITPDKAATARVQQILNDVAKADNKARIFDESGVFGPKTEEHLIRFQQKHNISPATGIVGPKTWKALLERWAALRPLPLA